MEADRPDVEKDAGQTLLNIGCGWDKTEGWTGVDGFAACEPDVLWNLNETPWPWSDNSVDRIFAAHVLEHLQDFWSALSECARILKPGGYLEVRVPDASNDSALTYRDHLRVFNLASFNGINNMTGQAKDGSKRNSWFEDQEKLPLNLVAYVQVPFTQYQWMPNWLLRFCSSHMRNFIWEQRFMFQKV